MPTADRCPGCDTKLAAVVINLDDRVVSMRSCTRCDKRWWIADGELVDPTKVFAKKSA